MPLASPTLRARAICTVGALAICHAAQAQTASGLRSTITDDYEISAPATGTAPLPAARPAEQQRDRDEAQYEPADAQPADIEDAVSTDRPADTGMSVSSLPPIPGADPEQQAEQQARRRTGELDPFAPLGVQAGAFMLFPSIGVSAVVTDNVGQDAQDETSDFGLRLSPALRIQSDWVRHQFTFDGTGALTYFADNDQYDEATANVSAALRLDIRRSTSADIAANYALSETSSADREVPDAASGFRREHDIGLRAGLTHRLNRLSLTGTTGIRYRVFEDVELAGGGVEDNEDRNYLEPSLALRASYETSPAIRPFAETGYTPRIHDKNRDRNGIRRDSHGGFLRAGVELELSPIWAGNVALRYDVRKFESSQLATIHALGADASLVWRPTRLTDVTFTLASAIDESADAGVSGSRTYTGAIALNHALRENLRAGATAGIEFRDYVGASDEELMFTGGLSLSYLVSREIELLAGYDITGFESTLPGADYIENRFNAGFRFRL